MRIEEEPLSKRQKSEAVAQTSATVDASASAKPSSEPAHDLGVPFATANSVSQPMDVLQLTDEQKKAILDLIKAVKTKCREAVKAGRDVTIAESSDVGHGYTVTFKPTNEAAGQKQDDF